MINYISNCISNISSSSGLSRGSSTRKQRSLNTLKMEPAAHVTLDPRDKPEDDKTPKHLKSTPTGITTLAVFLSLVLATPTHAANLKVLDKYFYGEVITNGQANHRQRTTRIPNIPDKMCFGWIIKVEPIDELVKITEIFTLPAAPKVWGGVEDDPYSLTTTSKDRKTATTNRFAAIKSGRLENSWCITQGDQSGTHHIVVLNGTQVLAEFEFEVYD